MKFKAGIICPVESELKPFKDALVDLTTSQNAKLTIYEGKLENLDVVILFCGVCKINAAIATQILIDKYNVNCIIVSGTAGGLDKKLKIGDTVISTQIAYHDVADEILTEYHPWMPDKYFNADKYLLSLCKKALKTNEYHQNIYFGKMVTGEKFIDQDGRIEINEKHKPLCVDMETAAVAHVCYVNDMSFIAIRSMSDIEEESGIQVFDENCTQASINSYKVVKSLLKQLFDEVSNDT